MFYMNFMLFWGGKKGQKMRRRESVEEGRNTAEVEAEWAYISASVRRCTRLR